VVAQQIINDSEIHKEFGAALPADSTAPRPFGVQASIGGNDWRVFFSNHDLLGISLGYTGALTTTAQPSPMQ
jgi:hypothetical protein